MLYLTACALLWGFSGTMSNMFAVLRSCMHNVSTPGTSLMLHSLIVSGTLVFRSMDDLDDCPSMLMPALHLPWLTLRCNPVHHSGQRSFQAHSHLIETLASPPTGRFPRMIACHRALLPLKLTGCAMLTGLPFPGQIASHCCCDNAQDAGLLLCASSINMLSESLTVLARSEPLSK